MCGRYLVTSSANELAAAFDAVVGVHLEPRYNIAPTQPVPIVREDRDAGGRRLALVRWGLVPHWAKDVKIGNRLINARAESAAEKPAFRDAMRYRRCLVPADGLYEWAARDGGSGGRSGGRGGGKQPHVIRMTDERPFAMAGLWEHWQDANGNELETCVILTTRANAMVARVHERMPVILEPSDYDVWLNVRVTDAERVRPMLRTYPAEGMMHYPVSSWVNSPRHDDARCIEPIEHQGRLL